LSEEFPQLRLFKFIFNPGLMKRSLPREYMFRKALLALLAVVFASGSALAQESVARKWNEALLFAIRKDLARPTIHARNLFHTSAAMYDSWAVYDDVAETYLLGKTLHGFTSPFNGIPSPIDQVTARETTISYACYRMLRNRFVNSPGNALSYAYFDSLMVALGHDPMLTSTDYANGAAAELGNYIAAQYIAYGNQDGSNQLLGYANQYYEEFNNPLAPQQPGNPYCIDANRWQRLTLSAFIDQSGNSIPGGSPPFLSPEWGNVAPFSLTENELTVHQRDGFDWPVYHDPGVPAFMDTANVDAICAEYQWTFSLVSIWQSHLDTADGVMWDISPASMGNIQSYPQSVFDYQAFYNTIEGGDPGQGYATNPTTGQPYAPQLVKRGDYARVLAEFWADGPSSETPPGHWFTIFNHVSEHPQFEKRYMGQGNILPDLEWDVKGYFTLGGAMHDAAVTAWGIKGYYDYVRPISAIRYMARLGQSTDTEHASYHPAGIPLVPGFVEIIGEDDPLAVDSVELVGKIKLYTWRGHDFIEDSETDMAGVGWIPADRWYPYQRPSFVTPPFAGYISGHSTYSRTAAEAMTLLTGSAYFPGGMSEFLAPQNAFLEFEQGPSHDVILQWATYRDASDQCSLSRIWGGIHPPMDDIPGRHIGMVLGPEAFHHAKGYFDGGEIVAIHDSGTFGEVAVYPNPAQGMINVHVNAAADNVAMQLFDINGKVVRTQALTLKGGNQVVSMDASGLPSGVYVVALSGSDWQQHARVAIVQH